MDHFSTIIDTEEADWLQKEVFDFDNGVGPVLSNEAPDEDDVEDEIFIGPVTHFERCAAKAVERLTPNSCVKSLEASIKKDKCTPPILYSISKYTYKENSPVAVVHPMCLKRDESAKNEDKENKGVMCKWSEKEKEMNKKDNEKKKIQRSSSSNDMTRKVKQTKLKAPGLIPSLLPAPGKLKLVPSKASGIKPPKPLCPSGSSCGIPPARTSAVVPRSKLATPNATVRTSKLPGSTDIKAKISGSAQGVTPSRRRSVGCGPRRPSSTIPKAGAATPRPESVPCAIVPRSLMKKEGTPSNAEKEKNIPRVPIPKSRLQKSSGIRPPTASAETPAEDPLEAVDREKSVDEDRTELPAVILALSPDQFEPTELVRSKVTSIQGSCTDGCPSDASTPNEKSSDAAFDLDDVFTVPTSTENEPLPVALVKDQRNYSPGEMLLLDVDKACANSPLIKFSPPLHDGPPDPFRTGSTPVQHTDEGNLLLPALADENPVNVDLIQF